jgi:hypothetical protein
MTRKNLGETGITPRLGSKNPMRAYDQLPPALRGWMRDAVLPWSARSCLKIWNKALREGLDTAATIDRLDAIEQAMLAARGNPQSSYVPGAAARIA